MAKPNIYPMDDVIRDLERLVADIRSGDKVLQLYSEQPLLRDITLPGGKYQEWEPTGFTEYTIQVGKAT